MHKQSSGSSALYPSEIRLIVTLKQRWTDAKENYSTYILDKTKFFNSKKIFSKPAWTPKEVAK
jgi:hypothetical protein